MLTVMVVDDEPIVGLTIKSLLNWEDFGFSMKYEASNGKQALKILEGNPEIDVIITDMNMPVMGGLELIKILKEREIPASIVVLSAYEDYAFVRNAFKLGVNDYILKTELDGEKLLAQLNSSIDNNHYLKNKKVFLQNETDYQDYLKISKEHFLKELIQHDFSDSVESSMTELKIRLSLSNVVLCCIWVDDYGAVEERYHNATLKPFITMVLNSIEQVLSRLEFGEVISISPQEYLLFLSYPDSDPDKIREAISCVLEDIKLYLFNYVNINVSVGVSKCGNSFDNINSLFVQARDNSRLRLLLGKQKIIFAGENFLSNGGNSSSHQSLMKITGDFGASLESSQTDKAMNELAELCALISGLKVETIESIYFYYMEVIFEMVKIINRRGSEVSSVFGKDIDFYERIKRFDTCKEINIWLMNLTRWVLDYLQTQKICHTISQALTFINDNFTDENISLKTVSSYVNLSENHFSVVFAKEVGEPFKKYIINLRINKAKELMKDTNLKIYEICEKVGYRNVEHFSRIFKKVTGVNPNNFKSGC